MNNLWSHFQQTLPSPSGTVRERQTQWLMDCLATNRTSAYGEKYGFAAISSIEEFQQRVPVVEYETLAPLIDSIANGLANVLFCADALAFEKTGGSHSGGKLIPYTARGLDDFRRALTNWLNDTITEYRLTEGRAYWALSPAATRIESTRGGIPIGAGDELYLGDENLAAFAGLSAVPLSLGAVEEMADWQLLTLYFLTRCDDLKLISVWSPAFLTSLLTALRERQQELIPLLAHGGLVAGHSLTADADALRRYREYLTRQETRLLWPELALISCWTDAASRPLAVELMRHFPGVHLQPKGLLSTEAIISVPDSRGHPRLCVDSNFYEFIDESGRIHLADDLTTGEEYGVIVTTNSGLYRYLTHDRVLCVGDRKGAPLLRFTGRSGVNSDLVGEKLTEPFVIRCLDELEGFAALAQDAAAPGYVLLLDKALRWQNSQSLSDIERRLCNNPQYDYARRLGQLAPLRYAFIENPVEHYLRWRHQQGRRLGEIKIPALFTSDDWRDAFQIRE
ncbi:hypothetical protein SOASR030_28420 [Leminorella grimontii]|uniref:GH3 middle domain-containing protein n=1 Tax=Leminorella grimontii TaxID=82981 RepID=A0AAV5N3Q0_9GAMM|nr:GH3 auxin-responsive promoter family protein [Leminorella grimontii]GKX56730.1 hypothetical protein SOASR030_28420 [Leminorella grimontii]VFS62181.1 GH3 auxin-responsive promoter [Leminorella grimontii]